MQTELNAVSLVSEDEKLDRKSKQTSLHCGCLKPVHPNSVNPNHPKF